MAMQSLLISYIIVLAQVKSTPISGVDLGVFHLIWCVPPYKRVLMGVTDY